MCNNDAMAQLIKCLAGEPMDTGSIPARGNEMNGKEQQQQPMAADNNED